MVSSSTFCVSADEIGLTSLGFFSRDLTEAWNSASCIINKEDSSISCPGDDRKCVVFQE